MSNQLVLVKVRSVREETEFLAHPEVSSGDVVPVLDEGDLPQTLEIFLEHHKIPFRLLSSSAYSRSGQAQTATQRSVTGTKPSTVIAFEGVDESVAHLAGGLCGVPVTWMGTDEKSRQEVAPLKERDTTTSSLVLLRPDRVTCQQVLATLQDLLLLGSTFGLVLALDPLEARSILLRTLLVGRIEAGGGNFQMLSSAYAPALAEGAPRVLCPQEIRDGQGDEGSLAPEMSDWLAHRSDVLLLSGHANPFDADLGKNVVLCARSNARRGGHGVFPCFHDDGACFRQPDRGRPVDSLTGLLSLEETTSRVMVLSGCNLLALGRSWFDPARSIAYQASCNPKNQAVIASAGVSRSCLELDFLLLALAAEGRALGEIVRAVNQARWQVFGQGTGLPQALGPLVLLGNPLATIEGLELQHMEAEWEGKDSFLLRLGEVDLAKAQGVFLRISVPPQERLPYVVARKLPANVWCRGLFFGDASSAGIYLWLHAAPDAHPEPREIVLDLHREDPRHQLSARLSEFLGALGFWPQYLKGVLRLLAKRDKKTETTEAARKAVTLVQEFLTQALVQMETRRGILAIPGQGKEAMAEKATHHVSLLSAALLECAVELTWAYGSYHYLDWSRNYIRSGENEGPLGLCTCSGAELYADRYRRPEAREPERSVYYCASCGAVGEDDGRRRFAVLSVTPKVQRGDPIRWQCECRADAAAVEVHFVAALECFWQRRRIAGERLSTFLEPNTSRLLEVEVVPPHELEPGAYPCTVLAVVNGSLFLLCQMVEIV